MTFCSLSRQTGGCSRRWLPVARLATHQATFEAFIRIFLNPMKAARIHSPCRELTDRRERRGRELVARLATQRADAQREAALLKLRLDGCRLGTAAVQRSSGPLGAALVS